MPGWWLASGNQRRLTGSVSASDRDATMRYIYKYTINLLYFTLLQMHQLADFSKELLSGVGRQLVESAHLGCVVASVFANVHYDSDNETHQSPTVTPGTSADRHNGLPADLAAN